MRSYSEHWFSGPLAYEWVAGWNDIDDSGLSDACARLQRLLGDRPCLSSPATIAGLYGQWQPHFVGAQAEVVRRYAAIVRDGAIRESTDHVLLSADELVAQAERVFGLPGRLVILALPASEVSYLAGSASRRSRFCSWLRRLESRALPLAIVAGVPLEGAARATRETASTELRFRSRRRPPMGGPKTISELMGILESADREMLALLLGEGASRVREWKRNADAARSNSSHAPLVESRSPAGVGADQ